MIIHVLKILQYCGSAGHRSTVDMFLQKCIGTEISGQDVLVQLLLLYGICSCTDSIIKCIKYVI